MKNNLTFNTSFEILVRTSITHKSTNIPMYQSYRSVDKKNPIMRKKNKALNIMKFKKIKL